jgi:hypothetical protein
MRSFCAGVRTVSGPLLLRGRVFTHGFVTWCYNAGMRIYVYVSQQDPDILGFTSDEAGANLPDGHGPWREEIEPGVVVIDTDDDPIAKAVRRDGFYVFTDCSGLLTA